MELKRQHQIGIAIGLVVIASAFLFNGTPYFPLIFGVGIIIGIFPFVLSTIHEGNVALEKEEMFLEFARNLVESVKMGASISKSIVLLKKRDYRSLSKHVQKLANQISMGIPLGNALQIFSKDVANKKISRAIVLIRQAERAGGDIGEILESVAEAVNMADKLKKERKSAISTLIVQGFKDSEMANSFLDLLLVQGLFTGLIIGKLAEGNLKRGIKHSFILMLSAFLISVGSNAIFGG